MEWYNSGLLALIADLYGGDVFTITRVRVLNEEINWTFIKKYFNNWRVNQLRLAEWSMAREWRRINSK